MTEELNQARTYLLKMAQDLQSYHAGLFTRRLEKEVCSSMRYNHFFTVAVFQSGESDANMLFRILRENTRSSDIIELIPENSSHIEPLAEGNEVGIILTETGPDESRLALERIVNAVVYSDDIRYGIALFPDDSTDADTLLDIARRCAAG